MKLNNIHKYIASWFLISSLLAVFSFAVSIPEIRNSGYPEAQLSISISLFTVFISLRLIVGVLIFDNRKLGWIGVFLFTLIGFIGSFQSFAFSTFFGQFRIIISFFIEIIIFVICIKAFLKPSLKKLDR